MTRAGYLFQIALCIGLAACQQAAKPSKKKIQNPVTRQPERSAPGYVKNLKRWMDSMHIGSPEMEILIEKKSHVLSVLYKKHVLKKFPVVLGDDRTDDKLMKGDRMTPEGDFYIVSKYPHPKWKYFLWLNYPTKNSFDKIEAAKRAGKIPANASPGGEVGIHGVPAGKDWYIDSGVNWTLGCVSLRNADIAELYPVIGKKTRIRIVK